MSETLSQDQWIGRVLGVSYARAASAPPRKQVTVSPAVEAIAPPDGTAVRIGEGRERSNAVIAPPVIDPAPRAFTGETGKKIVITRSPSGGPCFTAPPPPVTEVTFSGGGGKGAALPGAVRALEESGVLKDSKKIAGASVGSMTAALVAAGITADEFETIANDDSVTGRITEGSGGTKAGLLWAAMKNKVTTGSGNPLTGQGLEDVVRDVVNETLRKRMLEYMEQCGKDGKQPDADVVTIAKRLTGAKNGPTFGELRTLSKVIPQIKEVVITGTYTKEFLKDDKGKLTPLKDSNDRGQLYVFDADSEPDLEVAVAVHASASFPAAFKPVDITLSSGLTVRFIDGGVMNNTPTTSSIGNERALDPMPDHRGMTFVFEDKEGVSAKLLKGGVTPDQGFGAKLVDWFVGSDHKGAEYAKNRDMTDRPEEIVVVPLTFALPPKKKGGKSEIYDMRDGTLDFNPPAQVKLGLQHMTREATNAQIEREKQPKTREFASDAQMFVSITLADLKTLKDNDYPGADAAFTFRERVAEMIEKLLGAVRTATAKEGGRVADALDDKNTTMALDELETLAGEDVDFQGYVGREMNRGGLDLLLEALRKRGGGGDALKATFAVEDALKARTYADNILKTLLYPKMKSENKGGAGIETLLIVEGLLRGAKTPDDVNLGLKIAIDHFRTKSDRGIPKKGHKKFAQELARRVMS